MKLERIKIVYSALLMHINVFGQNTGCNDDDNVLDRCEGKVFSHNNIYVDFGEIGYQCNCVFSPNSSGMTFYQLAINPGYDNCGTSVQIEDSNNTKYRLPCTAGQLSLVTLRNLSGAVKLTKADGINGPTNYCLRVFTNDASKIITGSCGILRSLSTERSQTTSIGTKKTTAEDKTQIRTEETIQTTPNAASQTQTTYDELVSVNSQTTQEVVRGKNEQEMYTVKWEIIGAGIGVSLLVLLSTVIIVMRIRKRRVKEMVPYRREPQVTRNQIPDREDEKARGLTENPLYQPADDFEDIPASKELNSKGKQAESPCNEIPSDIVEYGLNENPLYQSADDEINEIKNKSKTKSNTDPSVYSEIDDNVHRTQENSGTYDYAYTHSRFNSMDN